MSSQAIATVIIESGTVTWTGGAGTANWGDAANWSSDAVPNSGDAVEINVPGPLTIDYATGADTIYSLTSSSSQVTLDFTGGSLALLSDSDVNGPVNNDSLLDVLGGRLTLNGNVTSTAGSFEVAAGAILRFEANAMVDGASSISGAGSVVWTGESNATVAGTYAVSGSTTVLTDSVVFSGIVISDMASLSVTGTANFGDSNITTPSLQFNGGSLTAGNLTVTGQMLWNGTIAGSGTLTIPSGVTVDCVGSLGLDGVTLNNQGLVEGIAGCTLQDGATINNLSDGQFLMDGASYYGFYAADASPVAFNNAGAFTVANAVGIGLSIPFNNSGSVDVQQGTLGLAGAVTSTGGSFQVAAGAELLFDGNATLDSASSISGAGSVVWTGESSATVAGTYDVSGSTTDYTDSVVFSGPVSPYMASLYVYGGADFGDSNITTPSLQFTAGLLTAGNLTVTGQMVWSGTIAGSGTLTIPSGVTVDLAGGSGLDGVTLNNQGIVDVEVTNGSLTLQNDATINNLPGGQFEMEGASYYSFYAAGASPVAFNNQGTFTTANAATVAFSIPFNNSGSVEVQQGELNLAGEVTSTGGSFQVAAGAELQFDGNATLDSASSISGAGSVVWEGESNATVAGSYAVTGSTSIMSGGNAAFSGPVIADMASLSVTGTVDFGNSSITTPTLDFDTGLLTAGNLTVTSAMEWQDGTIAGGGTLTIPYGAMATLGNSYVETWGLNGVTLNNEGTVDFAINAYGATFTLENGATINNLPGGQFQVEGPTGGGSFNASDNSAVAFNNEGAFTEASPTGVVFNIPFNNSGSVVVEQGELDVFDGGTSSGSFQVDAGAYLQFGGTQTLSALSSISGGGSVTWDGNATVAGSYAVSGSTSIMSGGSAAFSGPVSPNMASLSVANGTADFGNSSITMPTLDFDTGLLTAGNLTVTGTMDWQDGTIAGGGTLTISNGATLDVDGNANSLGLDGVALNNQGTVDVGQTYYQPTFILQDGATIINQSGGQFLADAVAHYGEADTVVYIDAGDASPVAFNNAGVFSQGSGATVQFNVPFNNSGSVDVQQGELELNGAATSTDGSFHVASGAILEFGGNASLDSASNITGAGSVTWDGNANIVGSYAISGDTTIQGGSAVFTGPVSPNMAVLSVDNGTADFGNSSITMPTLAFDTGLLTVGNLTVTGTMDWQDGTIAGGGALTIPLGTTLDIDGNANSLGLDGVTVNIEGNVEVGQTYYQPTFILRDGAAINNQSGGQFLADAVAHYGAADTVVYIDAGDASAVAFNNAGTFTLVSGATVQFNVPFNNSGSVAVQQGELELNGAVTGTGGSFQAAAGAILEFGGNASLDSASSIGGAGTINGDVSGAVQIAPSVGSGSLTINGNYAQSAGGALNINLAGTVAGTGYGQLVVDGAVSLGGRLNVSLNFPSAVGDSFAIIHDVGNAISGQFGGLPEGGFLTIGGQVFSISYQGGSGSDVVLTNVGNSSYVVPSGTVTESLAGSFGLLKNTSGTSTLSGNNTYTGATVVTDGTLIASTPTALPQGSALFVGAGAASAFGSPADTAVLAADTTAETSAAAISPSTSAKAQPASLTTDSQAVSLQTNVTPAESASTAVASPVVIAAANSVIVSSSAVPAAATETAPSPPAPLPGHHVGHHVPMVVVAGEGRNVPSPPAPLPSTGEGSSSIPAASAADIVLSRLRNASAGSETAWLWSVLDAQDQKNKNKSSQPSDNAAAVDRLFAVMGQ